MSPMDLIREVIDTLRRRWRVIVRVAVVVVIAALFYALQSPRLYQAIEVIQIEQPKVSNELAPGVGESASARQFQQIQQRLFTREGILEVTDKLGLFDNAPGLSATDRVNLMRGSVQIESVAAARDGFADDGSLAIVSITAFMSDPVAARDVAHEFAQRTLDLSVSERLETAQQTLDFFKLQEDALNKEIVAIEDEREAYRNQNGLSIPGSIDFQRSELSALNASLLEVEQQIIEKQGDVARLSSGERTAEIAQLRVQLQIDSLNADIRALEAQQDALSSKRNDIETALARVPEVERKLADFDRSLTQLQSDLSDISSRRREAETTYTLEERKQGGRLTVIEPATVPEYPISRSRKTIVMMGIIAGIGLGTALAFALDMLMPVIRTAGQMERRLGLRPVVSIPSVAESGRKRRGKRPPLGTL